MLAKDYHGTLQDFAEMPHYHPTLSEVFTYPAEELTQNLQKNKHF